jgi:oligopeptide/dipeptide ABC transporter ATP-binding protein
MTVSTATSPPVLELRNLVKHFAAEGNLAVKAVDGVNLSIAAGETVGLVGESGCGKSTLGRLAMGLIAPSSGEVRLDGAVVSGLSYNQTRKLARRRQMVFQDPYASLNPRRTIGNIIEEPLKVHGVGNAKERHARVTELMKRVGLPEDAGSRYPHEFSGGQRQRVGIARALALNPALIVADEPVSALDVSVQAQVINLMVRLQREFGLSYLFISHDLAVVQYIADRILVMYLGQIVESSDRARIWTQPLHPYTAALLAAHPTVDVTNEHDALRKLRITGEVPSQVSPPSGCRFHTRCPFAVARCAQEEPALRTLADGRSVACHFVEQHSDGTITALPDRVRQGGEFLDRPDTAAPAASAAFQRIE